MAVNFSINFYARIINIPPLIIYWDDVARKEEVRR